MAELQGVDVLSILLGMGVQTIIIARVNRVHIENLREHIDGAKETAVRAHRRIDSLLRQQKV